MNKNLQPSLASIERKFSTLPDTLLQQWIEFPETVDQMFLQQLESSTHAQQERERYLAIYAENNPNSYAEDYQKIPATIPATIKALIQRRCETLTTYAHKQSLCKGQLVLVTAIPQKTTSVDFHLTEPLVVLLNKPSHHQNQWHGWLISQETDYARHWDVCLDATLDAPLDPLAGMVQVWNPVLLHIDFITRTIGELAAERLAYINNIAHEHKQLPHKPTLLSTDPCYRYQALYSQASQCLSAASKTYAVQQSQPQASSPHNENIVSRWIENICAQLDKVAWSLTPQISHAMGSDDHKDDLLLDNALRFHVSKKTLNDGKGFLINIRVKLENKHDYSIELFEDDNLEHYAKLTTQQPETHFSHNPTSEHSELVLRDQHDVVIHRFSLKKD